jgi:ACR3 family arsenite efflux pump ArsB
MWIAAGVLFGFQVTSFAWRINREVTMAAIDQPTWLPPADIVNLFSMLVLVAGVFIHPALGYDSPEFRNYAFGLAMVLFVGYPFALAGHYELYIPKIRDRSLYFPKQEKIIISIITLMAIIYLIFAINANPITGS